MRMDLTIMVANYCAESKCRLEEGRRVRAAARGGSARSGGAEPDILGVLGHGTRRETWKIVETCSLSRFVRTDDCTASLAD
ncbi:unnamed protein product [Zymoseptoria tritici ST99CH_3D7]|uniref:Uncharacterized protein n=1 Tax=Zymoseptoria tritici (strain ST99CH_3D7) TaxID=1276538 RepID=A0A1X7SA48_ZYMT9|nr:unnamed protein product [Zymoseptoria tritici ST99CH_3D7]